MKKLLTLVIAGGMLSFIACGPSQAELEAKAKATQDSIRVADSTNAAVAAAKAAEEAAVAAAAAAEKAKQDSIATAEAAAKDKGKAKTKPAVKPGQGRG
ncbi:MAG: hypothetical protein HY840_05515 [Bacteroidetes bacterium]|nr:hypothetical protein [Bacteroidota bacterium]